MPRTQKRKERVWTEPYSDITTAKSFLETNENHKQRESLKSSERRDLKKDILHVKE
jgi:hypothetical protein